MKYSLLKNKRHRILYANFEKKRKLLFCFYKNLNFGLNFRTYIYHQILNTLPREASLNRIRNRCILTNRSRGIYRKFGLSRLMFRKMVWQGLLYGIKKASW